MSSAQQAEVVDMLQDSPGASLVAAGSSSAAAAVPASAQKAPSVSTVPMATEASVRRNLTAGCLFVLQGLPAPVGHTGKLPEVTAADVCTAIGLTGTAPVHHNAEQRLRSSLGSSSPYNSVYTFSSVLAHPSLCDVPMAFDQEGEDPDEDDKVNLRVPTEWEDECHDVYGYPRPEPSEEEAAREPPRSVVSLPQQRACYDVLFDLVENHFALTRAAAQLLQAMILYSPKAAAADSTSAPVGSPGGVGTASARAGKQGVWEALRGGRVFAHQSIVHAHCLLAQLKHASLVGTGCLLAGRAVVAAQAELLQLANAGGELPSTATAAFLRAFSADAEGVAHAGKKRTRSDVAEEKAGGAEAELDTSVASQPHLFTRAYPILGPDMLFRAPSQPAPATASTGAAAAGLTSPPGAPGTPAQLSFAAWASVGAGTGAGALSAPALATQHSTPAPSAPTASAGAGTPAAPAASTSTPMASSTSAAPSSSSSSSSSPLGPSWMSSAHLALLSLSSNKDLTRVALAVHRVRVLASIVCQYVEQWEKVKSTVRGCVDAYRALHSSAYVVYAQEDSACVGATQRRDAASEAKEALDEVMRGHALRALADEYGMDPSDVVSFHKHHKKQRWSKSEAAAALSSASSAAQRQLFMTSFDDMFSDIKLHSKFLDLLPSEQLAPAHGASGSGSSGGTSVIDVEERTLLAAVVNGQGDGVPLIQLWKLRKAQQDVITETSAEVALHGAQSSAAKALADYCDHCVAYAAVARLRARASLQRGLLQALSALDSAAMELVAALITKACRDEALRLRVRSDLDRTEAALREHVAVYGDSAPGLRASLQQQLGEVGARLRQGEEGAAAVTEWLKSLAQDSLRLLPLEARQGLIGRFVRLSHGADASHALADLRTLVATEPPMHLPPYGKGSLFDPDALFAKLQRSRRAAEGMSSTSGGAASSGAGAQKRGVLSPYHNPAIHHLSINAIIPALKMGELVSTLEKCADLCRSPDGTYPFGPSSHPTRTHAVQVLLSQVLHKIKDSSALLLPSLSHGLPGCATNHSLYDTSAILGPADLPPARALCRQAAEGGAAQEEEEDDGIEVVHGSPEDAAAGPGPSAPGRSPQGMVVDLSTAHSEEGEEADNQQGQGEEEGMEVLDEEIDVMALAAGKERRLRALPQAVAVGLGPSLHASTPGGASSGLGRASTGRGHGQHRTWGRTPDSDEEEEAEDADAAGRGKRMRREGYRGQVHEEDEIELEEEDEEMEQDDEEEEEEEERSAAAGNSSSGCALM